MFNKYLTGAFTDENRLLGAVRFLKEKGYCIQDVYSPYAIHGIDEAMGLKRSRLPIITLIAGCTGLVLALFFQFWTSTIDWPINVGGKPDNSTLAFLPVTFEITVLLGGLTTVLAFFIRSRLYPKTRVTSFHPNVTNNTFALVIEFKDGTVDEGEVYRLLHQLGAFSVQTKEVWK